MIDLPLEIYRNIFQRLRQKDLQTCYLVSKNWYSKTILLNWEKVTIQDAKIELLQSHLAESNYGQYFKYGHLIKKLTIRNKHEYMNGNRLLFSKQELLALLSQLPNLNEIHIGSSSNTEEYLSILIDADMKHINNIDIEGFRRFIETRRSELYFLVNYRFRNTISKINLHYYQSTIQQIDVLHSLSQFKKLTELDFKNTHDMNLTPLHIQYMCPYLERLKYVSGFPMLRLPDEYKNINLNLKNLELHLPSLSAAYTRYLVDYFPDQCTKFVLNITEQNAFEWIDVVGMELALRLMEKIGRVIVSSIMFETIDDNEVQANTESKMTRYFKLLNAFTKVRESRCVAEFGEGYEYHETSFGITRNEKDIVWTSYQLQDDDFYGPHLGLDLPDKTCSVIGPDIFSSLRLELLYGDDGVITRALDYALLRCPNLEKFLFDCEGLHSDYKISRIKYGHQEDLTSSDAKHINTLQLEYIRSAQIYLDRLAAHLHNIEIVKFVTENWGDLQDNQVLDLTRFKKLKRLIYITSVDNEQEDECNPNNFVLFRFTNGKEHRFYIDGEPDGDLLLKYDEIPTLPNLTVICDESLSFDISKEVKFQ